VDAILKESVDGRVAFLRVQREHETLSQAVFSLKKALASEGDALGFVIATGSDLFGVTESNIQILFSPALQLRNAIDRASAGASVKRTAKHA
jgi:site-specific DNA-methyltransferase (adenine-specific)